MIFSVAQIVNYYWDHDSVYGKTIECGGMICEREMSLAGDGKQLKKVMTECSMVENSRMAHSIHSSDPLNTCNQESFRDEFIGRQMQ